jgi:hypothetical protein
MILILLSHKWKSFKRRRNSGRSIIVYIFTGLITLNFLTTAFILGISLDRIIKQLFPKQDITNVFFGFIFYYFFIDLISRFILQATPGLSIQPYLLRTIKRKTLIKFLSIQSLFSFFNVLPLFIFIPFSVTNLFLRFGILSSIAFIFCIISLCVANNYFVFFLKRKVEVNIIWFVAIIVALLFSAAGDYFGFYSLRSISIFYFSKLMYYPLIFAIPFILAVFTYYTYYTYFKKNLYLEETIKLSKFRISSNYSFIQKYGITGELVLLDLKLMLRNKRPRSVLLLSGAILFYGLVFYKPQYYDGSNLGLLLFAALFITGIFISNYGQFLFAWQSSHFDGIMTNKIGIHLYIKSKFSLMITMSTIAFLLSTFYGFISLKIIPIEIAAYFFNIGVHTPVVALFATKHYKGLDIGKSASFNYQGISVTQILYSSVIIILSMIIYLSFSLLLGGWSGIIAIGSLGIISFFFRERWINIVVHEFERNKYKILSGFREN